MKLHLRFHELFRVVGEFDPQLLVLQSALLKVQDEPLQGRFVQRLVRAVLGSEKVI